MKIVISSGHGKYCRGATGYIDEVVEARRVVDEVALRLNDTGVKTEVFHDDVSKTQKENLHRIVAFHNSEDRNLDVSVHFNAYEMTDTPMGTECLYVTQDALAQKVASAISATSGLKNRGPKKRTDLYFLNQTEEPAILIEVCFVDSKADVQLYESKFKEICLSIANTISGEPKPPTPGSFQAQGKCATFGGPDDNGVAPGEGLALISEIAQAPQLFLPYQPQNTTGLARRLNPYTHYIACRWDYAVTPKETLLKDVALVKATKTGITLTAFPADWGPNPNTGRIADLSPSLMEDLQIETNAEVEVTFPHPT